MLSQDTPMLKFVPDRKAALSAGGCRSLDIRGRELLTHLQRVSFGKYINILIHICQAVKRIKTDCRNDSPQMIYALFFFFATVL